MDDVREKSLPLDTLVTSVAPSPRLAAELDRVAATSGYLIDEIRKTNFEIDDKFPKEALLGIAASLTNLAAGSEEGALHALEYAASSLNKFRFSSMEIADSDTVSYFARGGRLDQALGKLISDVTTAKQFYSQSRINAIGKSEVPDHAIANLGDGQRNMVEKAQEISDDGLDLADRLGESAAELAEKQDSRGIIVDNLSRQTRDIANLASQERIEFDSADPRIARLAKLHRGARTILRATELTSAIVEITGRKIGHVLIAHFTEWFARAQEWSRETLAKIDELLMRWQEEDDAANGSQRRSFGYFAGSAGPWMAIIPAGEFMMGSPSGEGAPEERPAHKIIIENSLEVSVAPVTRGEFAAFVKATGHRIDEGANVWTGQRWNFDPSKSWLDPGFDQADDHPVVCVSWSDAKAYLAWLTKRSGFKSYRLLFETEWEYCCRAGTRTAYSVGETITTEQANFAHSAEGTTPIVRFRPNPWGLRDMHGNVWEWCEDDWHHDYSGDAPTTGSVRREGDGTRRVLRGGSWSDPREKLRSASRNWERPNVRFRSVGFRIARAV